MFLPMSWTSPLTVAVTTVPLVRRPGPASCRASMNGMRWATAFFITRADFTTCGRNILPSPKRSPTTFMPSMSGPSMTSSGVPTGGLDLEAQLLGVVDDVVVDALDEGVGDPLADRQAAPLLGRGVVGAAVGSVLLGDLDEPLGGVGAAVQHDVLDPLAQLGVDGVVRLERPGVDDAHVEAGVDRVVEEHGVDGLADRGVAAEAERDVRDARRRPARAGGSR